MQTKQKQQDYFQLTFARINVLNAFLMVVFMSLTSWPRLLLEVFLRKNMGERYFNIFSCLSVAALLVYLPRFLQLGGMYYFVTIGDAYRWNPLWYWFIGLFLVFSGIRYYEVRKEPSIVNFNKFSLSSGEIHPFFWKIKIPFIKTSFKTIETIYEPLPFFLIGLALIAYGNPLGMLLTICSILYSLGYLGAYYLGDNYLMDQIDRRIVNEGLGSMMDPEAKPDYSKGFRHRGRIPTDPQMRRKIAEMLSRDAEEDGTIEAK